MRGWRTRLAAHLTIDESTAVAVAQDDPRASRLGFWVTGTTVFLLWNLTTLARCPHGDALGDPRTYGLDAAACAAFMALLWPRLRDRETVAIAVVGAVVAVPCSALPPGIPVVLAAPGRHSSRDDADEPLQGPHRAALVAFALKLAGFLVPESALASPGAPGHGGHPRRHACRARRHPDVRRAGGHACRRRPLAAVGVAVVALLLRAPFIVVVVLGGATAAAALRALGTGPDWRPSPQPNVSLPRQAGPRGDRTDAVSGQAEVVLEPDGESRVVDCDRRDDPGHEGPSVQRSWRIVSSSPALPRSTSWWAVSPRKRVHGYAVNPGTAGSVGVVGGRVGPERRPAACRASPIIATVRAAVPEARRPWPDGAAR